MKSLVSFPAFVLSVLVFLAGVFPFTLLGIGFAVAFYMLWGFETRARLLILGGAVLGLVIDSLIPLPFGTHALAFILLGVLTFFLKRFMARRSFLGEFVSVLAGVFLAVVIIAAVSFYVNGQDPRLGVFLFKFFGEIIATAVLAFFVVWLQFKYRNIYGTSYVA